MDEFEKTLVELEAVMTDPELDKLLVQARVVNESIKWDPISTTDALTIVADLNKQWADKEFLGKEMHVTGPVYVGKEFGDLGDVPSLERIKVPYADHPFTAKEFGVINIIRYDHGALNYTQEIILRGVISTNGSGSKKSQPCAISIDQGVQIECKELTPSKVSAWLDSYYPETKIAMDIAIEGSTNEADATLSLADVVLPVTFSEKKQRKELRAYLKAYINNRIKYDVYVPYVVKIDGFCGIYDKAEAGYIDEMLVTSGQQLISTASIAVHLSKDKAFFELRVDSMLIGKDKGSSKLTMIPVSSILAMKPGRDILTQPNE